MAENKKSFLLYSDHKELFETLSDKDAAELIRHIFRYVNDENPISDNPIVNISFITIKLQLKRDLVKYEDTKSSKAKAGALGNLKRWNPDLYKKVSTSEMTIEEAISIAEHRRTSQSVANIAVIDNDNDNDNGNVIDINNTINNFAETSSATPQSVDADSPEKEKAFTDNPVKAKKEKTLPTPKPPTPFPGCMAVYSDFIIDQMGLPPKIDGQEGKALKTIIDYLTRITTDKEPEGIVNAFKYILVNKSKWDPFHQNQLKISQINSNLTNIINSIKNGTAKKSVTANNYDNNKYRTANAESSL